MKYIAVYCGASTGDKPEFVKAAYDLGKHIAQQGYTLIYGGGAIGIMGAVHDGVLDHGGHVIGIMPRFLHEREIASDRIDELIIVETMHERKQKIADMADAFVLAPGGGGSLDEFFEIYCWAQIGLHQKPIAIYNVDHFYTPLKQLLDHMIQHQFIGKNYEALAPLYDNAEALIEHLQQAKAVEVRTYDK